MEKIIYSIGHGSTVVKDKNLDEFIDIFFSNKFEGIKNYLLFQ